MRFFLAFAYAACLMADPRKLPPEFEAPAGMAMDAAPEFAADALLRIVESGRVADRQTALDLIEQAFTVAANAHFRVPMRAVGRSRDTFDTRAGSLGKAYSLKLDVASLQSRAVIAMLRLDPVRGREMFQGMAAPELPPLSCEDALVYDASPFYAALGAVAQGGFNAKERARQDHVALLLQYAAGVHAPAQIAPMLAAAKQAGLTPAQFDAVALKVGGQMEAMAGDARSFAATLDDVSGAMPASLAASFQKYLEKNQGAACKEGSAKTEYYWQSEPAERLMDGARKLRFGDGSAKVLSDADRARSEWKQQLADFEKDLAGWQPSSEKSEMDYYQQKCVVYQALVELIPAGPERDRALQEFVAFVNGSSLAAQSPAEWFVPVTAMLERVRNTNGGEPRKMLAALLAGGHPALALYASVEGVFDSGMPSWVTAGTGR
jgi:hypothetical protein